MEQTKILILGTNAYVEVFIDIFANDDSFSFVGVVENLKNTIANSLYGLKVHWNDNIDSLKADHKLVCSIGTTLRKSWIEEKEAQGFTFFTLRHPSAVIANSVEIDDGVMVDMSAVISSFTKIAGHVRIGRTACIGHHSTIGAYSTIHPGAIISGNCTIGSQVTISTGAVVIDNIKIGTGAVIAAGAVVVADVPDKVLVAGVPAKIIRTDYGPK